LRNLTFIQALLLALLLCGRAVHGEDMAPALEAELSSDDRSNGLATWWLYSPVQKSDMKAAAAPVGAREGAALSTGNGNWTLLVSPLRFVDFKPHIQSSSGFVWASTRVNSLSGGPRTLKVNTYCAIRVFVDGKRIIETAQPGGYGTADSEASIDLPKGLCEISVAVGVRGGFSGFQLNLTEPLRAKALPRAVTGDRLMLPTAAGKAPDSNAAAVQSLAMAARDIFIKPGDKVGIVAGIGGSSPAGMGPISARFIGPSGPFGPPLPPRTFAELGKAYWQTEYAVPTVAGVVTEISLEVKAGETLIGTKKIELYSFTALQQAASNLEKEIEARSLAAKRPLPHAALAVEKLRLFLSKMMQGEEKVSNDTGPMLVNMLKDAQRFAELEEKGLDPLAGKTGYFERAYQSKIDNAAQPYYIHVPSAHAKQKEQQSFPLVVFLHGYVPSYDKHRWWDAMHDFNALFEKNNAFLVIPFGRSNTDFQGAGEVDVMDAIADAKRLYSIDPDRVYLYGYSMGGMAVYHIAAHYPDAFAAAMVLAGRADSPLQNHKPLEKFHPYKQWLINLDNPISLCENLANIPVRIFHGSNDFIISADEAKRMEKRLQEIGCDAKLTISNGDHLSLFDLMATEEPLQWLLSQKRKTQPEKRLMKSYSLRYARQGEVEVLATTGELKPIDIAWTGSGNELKFTKESPHSLQQSIKGQVSKPLPPGLYKTPARCGPIREATCNPFIGVYGTSGSPEANARNKANAERFAKEWHAYTRSNTQIKADKDVSDDEKKSKNLFLFGEEQENLLHAAVAKSLPISVKDGKVTVGEKSVPLAGKGVLFMYPSALAAGDGFQTVVIQAGVYYGQHVGNNHKFDLLPDFIIYDDQKDTDDTGTNRFTVAGFFDGQWKLSPQSTWWADK